MALEALFLVRHGKAEAQAEGGDRVRPLSAEGRRRIAALLPQARGMKVDLALSSPYLRAVQTRELFLPVLGDPRLQDSTAFTPESDLDEALVELEAWAASGVRRIAVFTHNPFVTALAERLLLPGSWPDPVFHTPTVLALGFDDGLQIRQGRPLWVLHP